MDKETAIMKIFEKTELAFWQMTLPGGETSFSDSKATVLGYKPEEFKHFEDFTKLLHPDDYEATMDAMREHLEGEREKYAAEYRIKRKDGTYAWFRDLGGVIEKTVEKTVVAGVVIDISGEKQASDEFRLIAENTSDGIMIYENGQISYVSPAYGKVLGYSDNEEVGRSEKDIYGLLHPDDRDEVFRQIYGAIEKNLETLVYQFRARKKDGSYIWREDAARFIYDENGRHIRTYVNARDITPQKEAEFALAASEKRNRAIVGALPDLIFRIDSDYVFLDCQTNDPSKLYAPAESFIGKKVRDVMPQNIAETTEKYVNKTISTNELQVYQYSLEIGGKIRHFESRITVSGTREVLAIIRDISKQKEAEIQLQKLNQAVEQSPASVVITDLNGDIEYVNPQFCILTGYSESEVIGENPRILRAGTMPEEHYQELWDTIRAGGVWRGEFHNKKKNGELYWEHAIVSSVKNEDGEMTHYIAVKEDITEKKRFEEDLRDQKMFFEQALNASSIGLAFAIDRKIVWANRAMEEMFGYSKEEYEGKDTSILYENEAEYKRIGDLIYKQTQSEKTIKLDARFRRKNGSVFWGHYKINPIDSENPRAGVIVSIIDINDRKIAEEKLTASEEKFRMFFEQSYDGIRIVDSEGYVVAWNKSMERISGMSAEEAVGMPIWDLLYKFAPEDKKFPGFYDIIKAKSQKILSKTPFDFDAISDEFDLVRPDGEKKIVQSTIFPIETAKGAVFGGIIRDVTEKKISERALRESEERFRKMAEMLPEAIFETDAELRVTYANDRAFELFGYDEHDLSRGLNGMKLIVPEHRAAAQDNFSKRASNVEPGVLEYKGLKKDGTVFPMFFHAKSIIRDGKFCGLHGIVVDITDRKKYEENLKKINLELAAAKEKAEESDRLKTAFLQNLSHEVRTPLNGIIGFSELIIDETDPETRAQYGELIKSAGKRLIGLVENVVILSQIETGQMQFRIREFAPYKVMEDLIVRFKAFAAESGVHIERKPCPDEKNALVKTDREAVSAIVAAFVENAIKFAPKGKVVIGCAQNNNKEAIFYVKDDGVGIKKERLDRIFNKFEQVEESTTRTREGAGVGLSIAKGLADRIGARIEVESVYGEGSIFSLVLPLSRTFESDSKDIIQTEIAAQKPKKKPKSGLVLIAEDEISNYVFFKTILKKRGLRVIHAKNGVDAVELFKRNQNIDFAFMDLNMPLMDGFEAGKAMKGIDPDVPIIALTAYATQENLEKVKEQGFDGFLTKPADREKLDDAIDSILS